MILLLQITHTHNENVNFKAVMFNALFNLAVMYCLYLFLETKNLYTQGVGTANYSVDGNFWMQMFMCVLRSNCALLKTWTVAIWRAVTPPRCISLQDTTVWLWWNICCIMGPMCMLKIKGTIVFIWIFISVTIIGLCWRYLTVTDSFSGSGVWFLCTTRVRTVTMRWRSCWWDMERLWTWQTFGSSHHFMKLQPRANMRSANYCSRYDTSDGEVMHTLCS